jgi:hypothetical protein
MRECGHVCLIFAKMTMMMTGDDVDDSIWKQLADQIHAPVLVNELEVKKQKQRSLAAQMEAAMETEMEIADLKEKQKQKRESKRLDKQARDVKRQEDDETLEDEEEERQMPALMKAYDGLSTIPRNQILDNSCQHECTAECPRIWMTQDHSMCTISGNDHLCQAKTCHYRISKDEQHPTCSLTGRVCRDDIQWTVVLYADRQGESESRVWDGKQGHKKVKNDGTMTKQEVAASKREQAITTLCQRVLGISIETGHHKQIDAIDRITQSVHSAFQELQPPPAGISPLALVSMTIRFLAEGFYIRLTAKSGEICVFAKSGFVRPRAELKLNRVKDYPPSSLQIQKSICAAFPKLARYHPDTLHKLAAKISRIVKEDLS